MSGRSVQSPDEKVSEDSHQDPEYCDSPREIAVSFQFCLIFGGDTKRLKLTDGVYA